MHLAQDLVPRLLVVERVVRVVHGLEPAARLEAGERGGGGLVVLGLVVRDGERVRRVAVDGLDRVAPAGRGDVVLAARGDSFREVVSRFERVLAQSRPCLARRRVFNVYCGAWCFPSLRSFPRDRGIG